MEELRIHGDPHAIDEPHDVLAADEFAIPSGPDRLAATAEGGGSKTRLYALLTAALAVVLYAALRRR
jgi:MYXO-CTERM domain-containing protein